MLTPDVAEVDSIQLISYLVYKCLIDMKHKHWHTRICVCVPVCVYLCGQHVVDVDALQQKHHQDS